MIHQGLFREDLFFRLNVVPMRLPPLRARLEDVPDLVHHFLGQAERQGMARKSVDAAAFDVMKRHRWPGNVRELENLVRRLVALYTDTTITAEIVENELREPLATANTPSEDADQTLSTVVEKYLTRHFAGLNGRLPQPGLYDRVLRDVERQSRLWRCFVAEHRGERVRVCERIVDAHARSFTDTSAWFWAAALGQSTGPWRAITRVEAL